MDTTNGIFVHRTEVYSEKLSFPFRGEVVYYEIENDENGRRKAVNVQRPNAKPFIRKQNQDRAAHRPPYRRYAARTHKPYNGQNRQEGEGSHEENEQHQGMTNESAQASELQQIASAAN
uniref:Glycine-rich protein 2 n=3 Tax=Lygus hesperus TaxID=30085 RepID=A0A0A9W683_LYGHE